MQQHNKNKKKNKNSGHTHLPATDERKNPEKNRGKGKRGDDDNSETFLAGFEKGRSGEVALAGGEGRGAAALEREVWKTPELPLNPP